MRPCCAVEWISQLERGIRSPAIGLARHGLLIIARLPIEWVAETMIFRRVRDWTERVVFSDSRMGGVKVTCTLNCSPLLQFRWTSKNVSRSARTAPERVSLSAQPDRLRMGIVTHSDGIPTAPFGLSGLGAQMALMSEGDSIGLGGGRLPSRHF